MFLFFLHLFSHITDGFAGCLENLGFPEAERLKRRGVLLFATAYGLGCHMVSHITAKRVPVPGAFDLSKLAHVTKEVTTWAGTAGTAEGQLRDS